jgi:hypothetical protein
MAEEQIVTNIVAKSDFSNLITDLNKVSSALTGLQDKLQATNKTLAAQVAVMNRSFAETMRSTGQFSTHFVSLSSDVEKFGSQLDKGQMKLGKFLNLLTACKIKRRINKRFSKTTSTIAKFNPATIRQKCRRNDAI